MLRHLPDIIKYKKNNPGALLINIVAGLAIIATLTVVSIPNFRRFQSSAKFDNAARSLVSDLRYAQQLAVTEQKVHGLIINQILNFYELVRLDEAATTSLKTVSLPADISFSSMNGFTTNFIGFNSYGSVHESGSIILEDDSSELKTIQVKPSGYVNF